ncbi:MAG: LuxR C-terminal-related transcriptional regulator [Nitrospirota bacterium]
MPHKPPPIAKITSPCPARIVHRDRLYRLLDRFRETPLLWIEGPPGAGKTTLVAGYLSRRKLHRLWYRIDPDDADIATFFHYLKGAVDSLTGRRRKPFLPLFAPEYLPNPAPFARRFFRALFGALPTPFILVFDNIREVDPASPFYHLLREGLEEVPAGGRVVLVSREAPPPPFARLQANQSIGVIDWGNLRLTEREAEGIIRLHRGPRSSREMVRRLHAQTDGWTAGLILLLKGGKGEPSGLATPLLFDYFAGEIFDKTDPGRQDFLLKSASLPEITPKMAEALTGAREAGRILSELNRQRFFVERKEAPEPIYQYHPLFRDFLCARAEARFDRATLLKIKRRAGEVMESSGRVEGAIDLFLDGEEVEAAIGLILRQAPEMVARGRYHTLAGWLTRLPSDRFDDLRGMVGGRNGNHALAWLRYWRGCCRLPFDPAAGRADFEAAFKQFSDQGNDPEGILLSWASIIETYFFVCGDFRAFDRWIAALESWLARHRWSPSPEVEARVSSAMTMALLYRRPHHPELKSWAARTLSAVTRICDPNLRIHLSAPLANYYFWMGDPAGLGHLSALFRKAAASREASPLSRILARTWEWADVWTGASGAVSEGFDAAEASGVPMLEHLLPAAEAFNALNAGDLERGRASLEQMESRIRHAQALEVGRYHYLSCRYHLLQADPTAALPHAEIALEMARRQGVVLPEIFCLLDMAQAHLIRREGDEGADSLRRARRLARGIPSPLIEFLCSVFEVQCFLLLEERKSPSVAAARGREKMESALRRAIALGRERHLFNLSFVAKPVMARLCVKALAAGIEIDYVSALVRKHRLFPEDLPLLCAGEAGGDLTLATMLNLFANAYRLSRREREVVVLLTAGKQAKEIARELGLAIPTVKEYLGSVYRKVGVDGRGPLMAKLLSTRSSPPSQIL